MPETSFCKIVIVNYLDFLKILEYMIFNKLSLYECMFIDSPFLKRHPASNTT